MLGLILLKNYSFNFKIYITFIFSILILLIHEIIVFHILYFLFFLLIINKQNNNINNLKIFIFLALFLICSWLLFKNIYTVQMKDEMCSSLLENNIKTVFIINGHHGNQNSIKNIDVKMKKISKNKLKVFSFSYWHFMERDFDHAGFVETSLMLAISKNVKMKSAKKGLITEKMTKQEIKKLEN